MNFLQQLMAGIADAWRQLTPSARINIGLAGVASALIIGYIVVTGAQPVYLTLRDDISLDEANKIIDVLKANSYDYKVTNGNQSIQIAQQQYSDALLKLDAANIRVVGRSQGPGFNLFDQTNPMEREAETEIKKQRAMKGEIEKTLMNFNFVKAATVNLTIPDAELFSKSEQPVKAGVVLSVTETPAKSTVKGLVSIISKSVPGLKPNHITISLDDGSTLYDAKDDAYAMLATDRAEAQLEVEKQRKAAVHDILNDMGLRGTVSVSAKMNYTQTKMEARKVTKGSAVSEYTTTTALKSTEGKPEGPPGATANVPEAGAAAGGVSHDETAEETITNHDPSITTTTTNQDGGEVEKYIVAVTVEGRFEEQPDPNDPTKTVRQYVPLKPEEIDKITKMARSAVGEGSGGPAEVTVTDWAGYKPQVDVAAVVAEQQAVEKREWMLKLSINIVQILVIMLAFFLLRKFLLSIIETPVEDVVEEAVPESVMASQREEQRREQIVAQIGRLTDENPELVALLIRTWMTEDED